MQAFSLILPADALGLARLLEALAEALEFWDQLSAHGSAKGEARTQDRC